MREIRQIIQEKLAVTIEQRRKLRSLVDEAKLFYRHTLGVAVHALVCRRDEEAFLRVLAGVKYFTHGDALTAIRNYRYIRTHLLSYNPMYPYSFLYENDHEGPCTAIFSPEKDLVSLANTLIPMLNAPEHTQIFSWRGLDAQSCVDLLDSLKHIPNISRRHHSILEEAMFKVAKRSGYWPRRLELQNVHIQMWIGGGSFGDVFLGSSKGELVAMKQIRIPATEGDRALKAFAKELVICSVLCHPNVLPLRGVFREGVAGRLFLVSPYMEKGDLLRHFEKTPPDTTDRLSILRDVVQALRYLHTRDPPVVHGDLKPANILISASGNACLCDYGMSYLKGDFVNWSTTSGAGSGGTLCFQAPELLQGDSTILCSTDIYSFGCMIYWLACGSVPYSRTRRESEVIMALARGEELQRPHGQMSDELWTLCRQCLERMPILRPSAIDCVRRLRSSEMAFTSNAWPLLYPSAVIYSPSGSAS